MPSSPDSLKFDPFDHHEYGLIRISENQYVRCTNDCCKSGSTPDGWE